MQKHLQCYAHTKECFFFYIHAVIFKGDMGYLIVNAFPMVETEYFFHVNHTIFYIKCMDLATVNETTYKIVGQVQIHYKKIKNKKLSSESMVYVWLHMPSRQ